MEALTAVAVAALTIYDMLKAVDKAMVIGDDPPDGEARREERGVSGGLSLKSQGLGAGLACMF